ncbi:hypothetical protein EIJ50_21540, partial [Xanthomonas perforans]
MTTRCPRCAAGPSVRRSLRLPIRLCYCAWLPCTAAIPGCDCMTSNSAPTARLTAVAPFSSRLLALEFAAV